MTSPEIYAQQLIKRQGIDDARKVAEKARNAAFVDSQDVFLTDEAEFYLNSRPSLPWVEIVERIPKSKLESRSSRIKGTRAFWTQVVNILKKHKENH